MKLTREQSQKLLRERGIWITEACDKCGKLLGSVRWTRKGEPGEWCSAQCRDGIKASATQPADSKTCMECGVPLTGKRSDSEFCSRTHLMRHRRKLQTVQKAENSGNTPIAKQRLTRAENGDSMNTPTRATRALETAVSASPASAEGCV